jgi:hypothetical protein
MRRILLVLALVSFTLLTAAAPAAAKSPIYVTGATVQTPDGQPWANGKPVTLVVSARRAEGNLQFPTSGLAVIMQTDSERTKCIDVPLKLVSTSDDGALYAGVFYPFRAAIYDGKVQLGDNAEETFDITFDVSKIAAAAPVSPIATSRLPVAPAAQQPADTLSSALGAVPFAALVLAFWSAVAVLVLRRQPRTRTA